MRITVALRQGRDGEINPFDACCYEAALQIENAEITLLSMGIMSTSDLMKRLTRLGASRAVLLSDKAFAGADTLATAYTLSLAVNKLAADVVFCGRQTLEGDTGQVGPMLAELTGRNLITNVMKIVSCDAGSITCETRTEGTVTAKYPALITVERINTLRLPSIRSKMGDCEVWSAEDIGADVSKCGLVGSPTRVLKTYENQSGRRKCKFIELSDLRSVISDSVNKATESIEKEMTGEKLSNVIAVTDDAYKMASTVCDNVTVIPISSVDIICKIIADKKPQAVIWASDPLSKRVSAAVAARLKLGLCADCTSLEAAGGELIMYRPALSGSIIAKIRSNTVPAMATVRTEDKNANNIVLSVGYGAKDCVDTVLGFAESIGASLGASRKTVDNSIMRYENQIGLTGKSVSPPVYIAVGISGAVHHIVGMQRAGTVIAVNTDKKAPIFDYADYGIIADAKELGNI